MKEIVVLGGARTAFGTYGGALRDVSATDLGIVAAKGALERSKLSPEEIDQVIFGNVLQTSGDAVYFARHIGLKAGAPIEAPALTINRLCGSGLQAILLAAQEIQLGQADFVLAGGAEAMSMAPHMIRGARWGLPLGEQKLEDYLWVALVDSYNGLGMANTAENLGRKYGISRQAADAFALRSQQKAKAAQEAGFFAREIAPITIKGRKGDTIVSVDEHPRGDTTMEMLAKLKTPFRNPGTVTAGNASGVNDGAAALLLASADGAKRHGLTPRARVVAMATAGVAPRIMGIGPAPATRKLLERFGFTMHDIDVIELNEAFASQGLAVMRQLGLPDDADHVNPHGGAIALGHPLGASGARLAMTAVNALETLGKKRAIATMCIGVGQGIAMLIERV